MRERKEGKERDRGGLCPEKQTRISGMISTARYILLTTARWRECYKFDSQQGHEDGEVEIELEKDDPWSLATELVGSDVGLSLPGEVRVRCYMLVRRANNPTAGRLTDAEMSHFIDIGITQSNGLARFARTACYKRGPSNWRESQPQGTSAKH